MLEAVLPSPQGRPAKPSLAGVGVAPLDVDPRHCPLAACGAVSAPPPALTRLPGIPWSRRGCSPGRPPPPLPRAPPSLPPPTGAAAAMGS